MCTVSSVVALCVSGKRFDVHRAECYRIVCEREDVRAKTESNRCVVLNVAGLCVRGKRCMAYEWSVTATFRLESPSCV